MISSLLTLMAIGSAVPQGPTTTFFDDTFANGTWTTSYIVVGPGTASGSGAQVTTGNPGTAWRASHSFSVGGLGFTTVWLAHMMDSAVYDPATGPIGQLDFWLDYRGYINQRVKAALLQDTRLYVSQTANWLTQIQPWQTRGPDTLDAQDFIEQLPDGSYDFNSHPDFTVDGAPITFGFQTGNTNGGTGTLTADYDNFRVGINGVPATVVDRVGSPPNPNVLAPVSGHGPVIGTTWEVVVDHTSFVPNATLDFLALSFQPGNTVTPHGTLLCDPIVDGYGQPAGQPFAFSVPNAQSFVGLSFSLQVGSGDPGQGLFLLTNALDVSIGIY